MSPVGQGFFMTVNIVVRLVKHDWSINIIDDIHEFYGILNVAFFIKSMVPVQRSAAWNDREQLDLCTQLLIDSLEFVLKHAVVSLEVFDVDISLNCE